VRRCLLAILVSSACSSHAPDNPAPAPKPSVTPPPAQSADSFVAVPIPAGTLPGWTLRSAKDGWWSAAGDEQLFVSRVDFGELAAGKPAAARAALAGSMFAEAARREGGVPRPAHDNELPASRSRKVDCVVVSAKDPARNMSCGLAGASGPILTIEYTFYGDLAEDAFVRRAVPLVSKIAGAITD
jgi:hypothetical protein